MERVTTLGKGTRFGDLILKSDAPSPEKYNILSKDFSDNKRGIIFGVSRDKFTKVSNQDSTIYLFYTYWMRARPPHNTTNFEAIIKEYFI